MFTHWGPVTHIWNFWPKFINFHSRKSIWKYRLQKGNHFVSASTCSYNPKGGYSQHCHGSIFYSCSWCRHQMETFSALPVTGGFPSQGQWHRALMFSLICTWTHGWANSRDAGDLRRYRAHYDVAVMIHGCDCLYTEMYRQVSNIRRTLVGS